MADLYIRSKDGKRIEKMRHIAYEPTLQFSYETGKSTETKEGVIFVNGRNMGEYTEEQAIEILNDIEEIVLGEREVTFYQLPTFED